MTNDKDPRSHNTSLPSSKAWQDAPDLTEEERQTLTALKAAAEAMLAIPMEEQTPLANPAKFHGSIGFPDPEMSGESDDLVTRIQHDFSFLVNEFAFTAGKPQHGGGITFVDYKHANMVIRFSVHAGEWQASAWPATPDQQARQFSLDGVVAYLTRPPIDFAADQARPGLSQSEALSELARQLAPIAGDMTALFEPGRWPASWADIQAVLQARSAERARQFRQWRQSAPGSE